MDQLQIIFGVSSFILLGATIFLLKKYLKTNKSLKKYSQIIDIEKEAINLKEKAVKLKKNFEVLKGRHEELEKLTSSLEDESEMSSFGLYKPKYNFDNSEKYKNKAEQNRDQQKQMIKNKKAAYCDIQWTVDGSKAKGTKATNQLLKLALNAFNVECDNLILKATYKNIDRIEERMHKLHERIEKFLEPNKSHIDTQFLQLKIKELYIVHEYNEKVQEEKEEQRAIREQMKEEERAKREFEATQKKAEKEEKDFEKALAQAKKELEKAGDAEKDKMLAKIKELESSLEQAHQKKERALSMAQQTKRGHVYIISNIGSFGEKVYKIGMTRRLEPLDRVKELGDASVPFIFDVHAMIYSENAPELENKLHKHFNQRRLNKVNNRKEFFNVELSEIEQFCSENKIEIEFTRKAEAKEFYQTKSIETESVKPKRQDISIDDIDLDIDLDAA